MVYKTKALGAFVCFAFCLSGKNTI
jgi:hypothetical protein